MTDNVQITPIRAPRGLDSAGKALWGRYASQYDLTTTEQIALKNACVQADLVARLEAEIAEQPLVLAGRDHPVVNPLIPQLRLMQESLVRMLGRLDLPADDDGWGGGTATSQARRRAAESRWRRQRQWQGDDD